MAGSLKIRGQFDAKQNKKNRDGHRGVNSKQATLLEKVCYELQGKLFYSRGNHTHKNKIFNILHYITKINILINK